ncbi:hypothetical protein ACIZ62_10215 [Acetobacterium carbinolicum]|uniref:hypothetical protein n=1 Tax=Acetobacterium carbinolicum TaxID=52690 RepID=UPI0039BF311C
MMLWIAEKLLSVLIDNSKNSIQKFIKKIKYRKLRKNLIEKLEKQILGKYHNEVFFYDLDSFLYRNNVFDKVFFSFDSEKLSEYKTSKQLVQYYSRFFIEEMYIPTGKLHLHGHFDPASRRMSSTLTEAEPVVTKC